MRVIHIVEQLHRGAVENWLVRMLRYANAKGTRVDWTFYCTLPHAGDLDEEVRRLGATVVHSPVPIGEKLRFAIALRSELKRGDYAVLHCHHDLISAVYLAASIGLPIERRIVHVHNADENVLTPSKWKQRLLRQPMRQVCLRMADRVVGISNHTLDSFLAGRPRRSGRDVVHYYGVDAAPFTNVVADRTSFRREHGLEENALILLFAGRVVPEKNPIFAVDVLASLRSLELRAVLVFAGGGSQKQAVTGRARTLGIESSIRLLGWRNDVPEIMACSDWFILPRPEQPMEGFGLAVVEAQLAGLRLLLSKGIPDDPLLPTAVYRRLSLGEASSAWAQAALAMLNSPAPSVEKAQIALKASPMDMDYALDDLHRLYA